MNHDSKLVRAKIAHHEQPPAQPVTAVLTSSEARDLALILQRVSGDGARYAELSHSATRLGVILDLALSPIMRKPSLILILDRRMS